MAGTATFAADEGFVTRAREQLDTIAGRVKCMESAQRSVIAALVELWPTAGWLAAGCRTPKTWLKTHTGQSSHEAARLESIARLCDRNNLLADAIISGRLPLGWADKLARIVTDERAPFLTNEFVGALLDQIAGGLTEDVFEDILRWFRDRVDEETKPRNETSHSLVTSRSLFGGGELYAQLSPAAFAAVESALDAFRAAPDPKGSPVQRTFGERQADSLEDMARFGLAHDDCLEDVDNDPFDTYDGMYDRDEFDELMDLDPDNHDTDWDSEPTVPDWDQPDNSWTSTEDAGPVRDPDDAGAGYSPVEMEALRRRLQNQLLRPPHRDRRVVQPKSGVRINLVVDPYTASGKRPIDDLDGFVFHGEGWNLTRGVLEQFLCDSALVTTAMSGGRILDANPEAEQFTARQRRAIAARDRHCVFPGCDRPPKHCDAHHLQHKEHDGPTIVDNACLLCRFHHRLIHQYRWDLYQNTDGDWIATDPHGNAWKRPKPTHPEAP